MSDSKRVPEGQRILYVFDDGATPSMDWPEGSHIYLVPMTSDYEMVASAAASIKQKSSNSVTVIDYAERFNRKAFSIRDHYLEFMADFPKRAIFGETSIHQEFTIGRDKTPLWWLTEIAEKNTIARPSFTRLAAVCTIIEILQEVDGTEVWIDLRDTHIIQGLRANQNSLGAQLRELRPRKRESLPLVQIVQSSMAGLVQVGKIISKSLMSRWAMRGTGPISGCTRARYFLVTYFPFVDQDAWSKGRFINKYFGPFQLEAEKKYASQITWLALFARFDDIGWRESLRMGRQVNNWGYRLSFLEQWLRLGDFVSVFMRSIILILKFARKRARIAKGFVFADNGLKLNIWPLFEADWYDSFCGPALIRGLVYQKAFSQVFKQLTVETTVLYVAEMLAWEKALNMAAKENGDAKVVGVQHSIVPLLLLNYFNHEKDLRQGDSLSTMPQPDYLASVGEITRKSFVDTGWDEKRVFVWGAIRFQHFQQHLENKVAWNKRENKVIVALSISPEESREVLRFVYQAFKDGEGYEVIIKGHPSCPVELLNESLNLGHDSPFKVSKTPLSEMLPTAKAAVIAQSSAALESIACQCPVIVPRLSRFIDMNPLTAISSLPIHVGSPAEMKKVTDSLMMKSREAPVPFESCAKLIEDYCGFLETNEWIDRIENLA